MSYISCSFPGVIWDYSGGGVPLPCRKFIMVCFEFRFQFDELRGVMIYSSSLSESFIQCGEMKYQRHPGSKAPQSDYLRIVFFKKIYEFCCHGLTYLLTLILA